MKRGVSIWGASVRVIVNRLHVNCILSGSKWREVTTFLRTCRRALTHQVNVALLEACIGPICCSKSSICCYPLSSINSSHLLIFRHLLLGTIQLCIYVISYTYRRTCFRGRYAILMHASVYP